MIRMRARQIRRFAMTAAAGWLAGGLTVGIGARTAMRAVALTDDDPGTLLTLGGTLAVLTFGLIVSVPLVLLAVRRFLPRPAPIGGLVFGGALLVVLGVPVLLRNAEIASIGVPLLNRLMFGSLFLVYGVVVGTVVSVMESRSSRADWSTPTRPPG